MLIHWRYYSLVLSHQYPLLPWDHFVAQSQSIRELGVFCQHQSSPQRGKLVLVETKCQRKWHAPPDEISGKSNIQKPTLEFNFTYDMNINMNISLYFYFTNGILYNQEEPFCTIHIHIIYAWASFTDRNYPDSKVIGANMGPIWGQQDPGGPHVGPKNFAIWVAKPAVLGQGQVITHA